MKKQINILKKVALYSHKSGKNTFFPDWKDFNLFIFF